MRSKSFLQLNVLSNKLEWNYSFILEQTILDNYKKMPKLETMKILADDIVYKVGSVFRMCF